MSLPDGAIVLPRDDGRRYEMGSLHALGRRPAYRH